MKSAFNNLFFIGILLSLVISVYFFNKNKKEEMEDFNYSNNESLTSSLNSLDSVCQNLGYLKAIKQILNDSTLTEKQKERIDSIYTNFTYTKIND